MIQRINTVNCGKDNWDVYCFEGNKHNQDRLATTFKQSCGWSILGTYDEMISWSCLFITDTPWSSCWLGGI